MDLAPECTIIALKHSICTAFYLKINIEYNAPFMILSELYLRISVESVGVYYIHSVK